jgi:hypothetical protein
VEGMDIDNSTKLDVGYISSPLVLDEVSGVIENVIETTPLYGNIVDFEEGILLDGSPSTQMNFESNTLKVNFSELPDIIGSQVNISIRPKFEFIDRDYTLEILNDSTVIESITGLSGNTDFEFNYEDGQNITFYILSEEGLVYDFTILYTLFGVIGAIKSQYNYFAKEQLCYPNSTGYDSTYVGDTIINNKSTFDLEGFDFSIGNQIRIDFETQSSLVWDVKPSFSYFYNLTSDYVDLSDFMTNSDFIDNIENSFSESFVTGTNAFASQEGTLVSYTGFKATSLGNMLTIVNPHIIYSVEEQSGVIENKDDFYLNRNTTLGLYNEDAFSSMHSNRDYTCDIIFLDNEGRKTTVISGGDTSVYIPASESGSSNKLVVDTIGNPPTEAKYYKFAIKETKRNYNTIYGNVVYEDGIYRWIKLVGENKNKVKEGDILYLKSDYSGIVELPIKIKVIEVATNTSDFIQYNTNADGNDLIEESGLYFKIKQGSFNINTNQDTFVTYAGFLDRRYASRSRVYTAPYFGEYDQTDPLLFIPTPVNAGSRIRFYANMFMFKNGAFNQEVEIILTAQQDYDSVYDWWIEEVSELGSWTNFANDRLSEFGWDTDNRRFYARANRDGTARSNVRLNIVFEVNYSGGTLMFENYEEEQLDSVYYESVETYSVVNGEYFSGNILEPKKHILGKTFNCYSFGNGCESNTIKDSFTGNKFYINSNPTAVTEDVYRQVNRYADLTYSGVYQESTNVNKLNEFNLSLANYKDDLDKLYGPVVRLDSDGTDLLVIQQDKWSKVLYGKDLLYNADATTNLSRIENVLGQQVVYAGEYGISHHPESFDDYGTNSFASDTKRGVVLRFNDSNGLTEISNSGLRDYFKTLFRDNTIINIISQYDSFFDVLIMNIKYTINGKDYSGLDESYDYVTWVYSPEVGGFLGKQTFNPDSMLRVNNEFLSFKGADVYKHNIGDYSTFYDIFYPVSFEFNFNEDPSSRKIFKNISIEGNSAWNVSLKTDLQDGYVNQSDFIDKEGVNYGYIRGNNNLDLATISVTGLGLVNEVNVMTNEVFLSEIPSYISVGDLVYNTSLVLIGTITGITSSSITLSSVVGLPVGQFILSSKPSSVETSGIRGYYMNTRFSLQPSQYVEVYAVNSEVVKSFE